MHVVHCSVANDIPRADEVRALVKDLWDLRIAKLRKSVDHMITEQETYGKVCPLFFCSYAIAEALVLRCVALCCIVQLDNLTRMEINTVRQLLTESLKHTQLLRLHASHFATAPMSDPM